MGILTEFQSFLYLYLHLEKLVSLFFYYVDLYSSHIIISILGRTELYLEVSLLRKKKKILLDSTFHWPFVVSTGPGPEV